MIGVVVPAHNEAARIAACLQSIAVASAHPELQHEPVLTVVVLDHCTDETALIAARYDVILIPVEARNVGLARAAGADALLAKGARWLAFTDADTVVSPRWLVEQLSLQADAVCGSIGVGDWSMHGAYAGLLKQQFCETYTDAEGHRHIHGANLGVSAAAYVRAGGFAALASSEDVALVRALEASGACIAWSARPRVVTSSRVQGRAKGGFADAVLKVLDEAVAHRQAPQAPRVSSVGPDPITAALPVRSGARPGTA